MPCTGSSQGFTCVVSECPPHKPANLDKSASLLPSIGKHQKPPCNTGKEMFPYENSYFPKGDHYIQDNLPGTHHSRHPVRRCHSHTTEGSLLGQELLLSLLLTGQGPTHVQPSTLEAQIPPQA